MIKSFLLFGVSAVIITSIECQFQIGLGQADVTGPAAEVPFMGYAQTSQRAAGIHLRQYSRVFIAQDSQSRRLVYASVESQAISDAMKRDVVLGLQQRFGTVYRLDNVMLSAQHTHSGPGGYHQYVLYDFTCLGFIVSTYDALVNGIVQSIVNAHNSMFTGRIFLTQAAVNNVGINRSPYAYNNNPAAERNRFGENIDRDMIQLRFVNSQNQAVGAFNWLAIHTVSMNNTNQLISGDNFGFAAIQLEREFNPGQLVGRGNFVGAFSTSHSGDVSPNVNGGRCTTTGLYCDYLTSACASGGDCIATGPGVNHFESTRIIGQRIYDTASMLLRNGGGRELTGSVGFIHQFVDMPSQTGTFFNSITNRDEPFRGCLSAMGMSFGAGTMDGPGGFNFTQGDNQGNPFWEAVRDFLSEPTPDDIACHAPKPILLNTGRTTRPYLWQPQIVPAQLFAIGDAVISGLPGEFSIMAGRRMISEITTLGQQRGRILNVILSANTNAYSSYTVTHEEYQIQRFEGAATAFGPHTLTIYQQTFNRLYVAMFNGQTVNPGPLPPDQRSNQWTFLTPVVNDDPGAFSFGHVLVQPRSSYFRGEQVWATFVSANPRNNLMTGSTFFSVERLQGSTWILTATDAEWETRFYWRSTSSIIGRSEIDFTWDIPSGAPAGTYRIRYDGHSRRPVTGITPFQSITQFFTVQ